MPYRITPLVNDEYYHIYNRGVAKQPIFFSKRDYERFMLCLNFYRFQDLPSRLSKVLQLPYDLRKSLLDSIESNPKAVQIIAYCLMPNHFHLLIRQNVDHGISSYLRKISDSYTKYINTKSERVGPLFQGTFKAVHVSSDEQLMHLSRYIHLNPLVSFVVREEDFLNYSWSSLKNYLNKGSKLVDAEPISGYFSSPKKYLEFVMDRAEYGKELERIKHLVLE